VSGSAKVVQLNSRMMDHLAKRAQSFGERLDAIGQGPGQKTTLTYAQDLVNKTLRNVSSAYGDTGSIEQLAVQRKSMEDLIAQKELALVEQRKKEAGGGVWTGPNTVKALLDQIAEAQKALKDVTKLQDLEKLAPGRSKDLLALEKWYEDQRKALGRNQDLLLVLEKTYGDKRKAILEASVADMLNAWKGIQDFVKGLDTDTKYGATPQAALEAARMQYIADLAAAKGGDVGAMERITGDAQKYIDLMKSMYGSTGPMSATIAQIKAELLGLDPTKKDTKFGVNDLVTKTNESVTELKNIRKELKDTRDIMARLMERVAKETKHSSEKIGGAIIQSSNNQVSATTRAAVLSKVN